MAYCFSQAHIVFSDNGIITISNQAFVVVDNSAGDAIKRINGGHFITEGDLGTNRIRWIIGNTSDDYTVPFGVGTNQYLPLTFSTSGANGQGFIDLSTYATDTWKNSDFLPATVTNLNNVNNLDNSNKVLDRFYRIEALNYAAKPNLKAIKFPYRDIEHTVPQNTIMEAGLKAQRWNSDLQSWSDYPPTGVADMLNNFVQVDNIANTDLFAWWVLVDKDFPLPLQLLNFNAFAESNTTVGLKWSTAQEINVDRFDIERSTDGNSFAKVGQTKAVGNSQIQQNYYAQDKNLPAGTTVLYYRLKMIDNDNTYKYSNIEVVKLNAAQSGDWLLYPNPVSIDPFVHLQVPAGISVKEIQFFDGTGKLMSRHKQAVNNNNNTYIINLPINILASGNYIVRAICSNGLIKNFELIKAK
jgi:hypothetical protein